MYFAHGPISYLLNQRLQRKSISKLSTHEQTLVMILSILFGMLPDVDLAILSMTSIPSFQHHLVFTHSALFYISCWLLLILGFWMLKRILNNHGHKALNENLIKVIHYSFLIGTLSHLLGDVLLSYSITLFPIQKQITILGGVLKTNYFASYIFTPNFAIEIFFTLLFLFVLFKKYIKNIKLFKILLFLVICISFIYLSLTIYMNQKTYNMSENFNNGANFEDQDYDGVQDTVDSDTNNNGVNNIEEIDREKLTLFIKGVSDDKYLASNSQDTIEYYFGAFNSYRLISQGYFEQNLAIEPVLREYAKFEYSLKSYSLDIPYPTLLYEYILNEGNPREIDSSKDIGNIFFVINEKDTLLNMGVVVGNDTFGIVLEDDTRLVTHNENEILSKYPNGVIITVDAR